MNLTGTVEPRGAGVWMLDAEGRTEYVNSAMAGMLGAQPADLHGLPLVTFVPDGARHRVTTYLDRCRRDATAQIDLPLRTRDGSVVWALASTDLLPGDGGFLSFMVDITERKQIEDALRRSESNYRVLAETAQDHIFVIARGDRVEYVNRAAALQLETAPERLIGRLRSEIFPPDVAERQGRGLQRVLDTGEPLYVEGRTMYLEREVWLGTWLTPIPGDDGQVRAVLGVSRDITEQRRLQAELSNAQKLEAIGRLAGGIAHDFNNNLTAILGFVEMVLARADVPGDAARDLKEVQHAGERAAGLVRRLLAFGRRQVLQPTNLNLNTLIDSLRPMLERLIGESVVIDVTLAAEPWAVSGDATEFEQIVMNLALNARDAMPGGGTLTIETTNLDSTSPDLPSTMTAGPYVRLTIRDTGTGMDARTKERVFDPFFTTKPVGQGTGLGLSTVYGIVKQLNGSIWVDSEVGRGTAFHVYLPASAQDAADVAVEAAVETAPRAAAGRRATVLLVEDEETVRRYARAALELHGLNVIVAATPEDALSVASSTETPIALMLTDVVMPRMSGPELAARLRDVRPEMRVLYMSGYPATLVHGSLLDPSMRLISKPFRTADLLATIDEMLSQPGSPSGPDASRPSSESP